jgi:RNA polymerase sigma-70 factor (ECF subfamily)
LGPSSEGTDVELVELARRGGVHAYGRLVERYRDVAFRTAYLVCRNAADAEDAAQEAFVKAYYALDRFRADRPLRPWILRIVTNEARNRRRSAGRRERLALRAAERGGEEAAPSPEIAITTAETRRALLGALETLPERERIVVAYRYLLDLSEAEAAAALGIRPGTAKSRLSRGLRRLRAAMPADERPTGDADG